MTFTDTNLNDVDERTISRIQKLLALARDGGATEAEAELAMAKAQEFMAEHNLTMAALEAAGGDGERRQRLQHEKKLMFVWKRDLLRTVSAVNFCHVVLKETRTKSDENHVIGYDLIGRESNIVAVRNMFHYLLETIERLVVAEVGASAQERGSRYAHSFRLGASGRLRERLDERHEKKLADQEREARERQAANRHPGAAAGNALVIVLRDHAQREGDLNNDVRRGWEPGTTERKRDERNAEYAARERRIAEMMAADPTLSETVARYVAAGFTRERAEALCSPQLFKPEKPETERQRQKREEREDRQSRRYWEQQANRQRREERRVDQGAYRAGTRAAEGVGLDDQVGRSRQGRIAR